MAISLKKANFDTPLVAVTTKNKSTGIADNIFVNAQKPILMKNLKVAALFPRDPIWANRELSELVVHEEKMPINVIFNANDALVDFAKRWDKQVEDYMSNMPKTFLHAGHSFSDFEYKPTISMYGDDNIPQFSATIRTRGIGIYPATKSFQFKNNNRRPTRTVLDVNVGDLVTLKAKPNMVWFSEKKTYGMSWTIDEFVIVKSDNVVVDENEEGHFTDDDDDEDGECKESSNKRAKTSA